MMDTYKITYGGTILLYAPDEEAAKKLFKKWVREGDFYIQDMTKIKSIEKEEG